MQEWLHNVKIFTKNSEETRHWKENLQLILCQQDLITVFRHDGKESLEKSILTALMNNLTKNSLVDQLHLAMKLDQEGSLLLKAIKIHGKTFSVL